MNLVKIVITIMILFESCFGLRQITPRDQREKAVCHTTFKAAMHGVFYDEKGKLLRPVPLSDSSMVIDSNLIKVFEEVRKGNAGISRQQRYSALIKLIKTKKKHGEDIHFWISNRTAKEINDGKVAELIPEGTRLVPISDSRSSDLYRDLNREIEKLEVGGVSATSYKDRETITDLFFAEKNNQGVVPTFVTADHQVIRPLCALNPLCAELKGYMKLIKEQFAEGFEVTVKDLLGKDRTIRVIPFN